MGKKMDEENKAIVEKFYNGVFNDRDLSAADKYLDEGYIQHNPTIPTGREGFKKYFKKLFRTWSKSGVELNILACDGDLVFLYARHWVGNKMITIRFKTIDIFKMEDGQIMEHWDSVEGESTADRMLLALKFLFGL